MKRILSVTLTAFLLAPLSTAAHACLMTVNQTTPTEISINYITSTCPGMKSNTTPRSRACLKVAGSWRGACSGGIVENSNGLNDTAIFSNLVAGTRYKMAVEYRRTRWWRSFWSRGFAEKIWTNSTNGGSTSQCSPTFYQATGSKAWRQNNAKSNAVASWANLVQSSEGVLFSTWPLALQKTRSCTKPNWRSRWVCTARARPCRP